jgi:hypothetical protein
MSDNAAYPTLTEAKVTGGCLKVRAKELARCLFAEMPRRVSAA